MKTSTSHIVRITVLLFLLTVIGFSYRSIANQKQTPNATQFPGNVKVEGDLSVEGSIFIKGVQAERGRTVAVTSTERRSCESICQGKDKVVVQAFAACEVTS